ncbi:MAG: DUF58 domain-containing protein [Halobacteriales archaeon]
MKERTRRLVAAIGVVAAAGGVAALAVTRGTGGSLLRAIVYVVGGFVGVSMSLVIYREWLPNPGIDPPPVEQAIEQPAPGDAFDRTLAQFDGEGPVFLPDRNAIHNRLRDFATGILTRRGYASEEATRAIEAGEWPDDEAVSAFLQNPNTAFGQSWRDRIRKLIGFGGGPAHFQWLVRRTVEDLASRSTVVDIGDAETEIVLGTGDGGGAVGGVVEQADATRTTRDVDVTTGGIGAVRTGRLRAVVPVALAFVGFGFALQKAAVVLAGAVALGFAAYVIAMSVPPSSLSVERSVNDAHPTPGDVVEVTTTIHNEGDQVVPDLRVIDGVPGGLSVTEGSPRYGTALRPGESASFTYSVTARRGVHEFDPAYVVLRDFAGASVRTDLVPGREGEDASLTCVPELAALPIPVPLYPQTGEYLGRIPAGGGEGVEFHSTREYRPGDSTARIDWKHLAASADDELTTVRYREERAATVVMAIDADAEAYLASGPDEPGAVERSVTAAGRLFGSLQDTGDRVGFAAFGPRPSWIDPDAGLDHRARVERALATDDAFPPTPPEEDASDGRWVRAFHRRFPAESQVILLSPLCSQRSRFLVRQLRGYGHPVTIISPDPTVDETVGQRLARVERRMLIEALRETGVRVIDWGSDEELGVAVGRADARWSQ